MSEDPEKAQGFNPNKFYVRRGHFEEIGGQTTFVDALKHRDCDYYVLDLVHDKFSKPALTAYADACEQEYPKLAADIRVRIAKMP